MSCFYVFMVTFQEDFPQQFYAQRTNARRQSSATSSSSYKQELIKKEKENLEKINKDLIESSSGRGKSTEDTDIPSIEDKLNKNKINTTIFNSVSQHLLNLFFFYARKRFFIVFNLR